MTTATAAQQSLFSEAPAPRAAAPRVAVLIPCYNEERTVGRVVEDFRRALPEAEIYVYDNNSRDGTAAAALAAGAQLRRERQQGKGNVVRRMLADVEADIYLLVDGDATYDAAAAPRLVQLMREEQLDLVNVARVSRSSGAYRPGHVLGNRVLSGLVRLIFGAGLGDMLSGYKALSRRFVKSMPLLARGFEVETELAVHALALRMPIGEIEATYLERPSGSTSKLSTWRDGFRILRTILVLIKEERPLFFFSSIAGALGLVSLALGVPVVLTFLQTGLVPRLPTALLATGIMLLACLSLASGLILDTVTRGRKELKRLAYLAAGPAPPPPG